MLRVHNPRSFYMCVSLIYIQQDKLWLKISWLKFQRVCTHSPKILFFLTVILTTSVSRRYVSVTWYFNKMVLQNTLRSDVSAILKSIHVIRAYLSIIASRHTNSRTISADMDGFQDSGYIWAQGVLQYYLIEVVPWSIL